MNELTVRVTQRKEEADGICSFELVADSAAALPAFTAGAHIDVHVAPGLVRQYSLCNDPAETSRYRIAVLREPASRGGSAGIHERVRVGDRLQVSPPRNHFPLTPGTRSLLLAGGLKAVQTATIVFALPFAVVIVLMAVALWRGVRDDHEEEQQREKALRRRMREALK